MVYHLPGLKPSTHLALIHVHAEGFASVLVGKRLIMVVWFVFAFFY